MRPLSWITVVDVFTVLDQSNLSTDPKLESPSVLV